MAEIKMKPFNLERALAGDPVVYRNGERVVEIVAFKTANAAYPVQSLDVAGNPFTHMVDGRFDTGASRMDLFMAARTKTVWVNIYPNRFNETGFCTGSLHALEDAAKAVSSLSLEGGKTYPVEVEY